MGLDFEKFEKCYNEFLANYHQMEILNVVILQQNSFQNHNGSLFTILETFKINNEESINLFKNKQTEYKETSKDENEQNKVYLNDFILLNESQNELKNHFEKYGLFRPETIECFQLYRTERASNRLIFPDRLRRTLFLSEKPALDLGSYFKAYDDLSEN